MGRTAEIWLGFARGQNALTDVTVTWDPTTPAGRDRGGARGCRAAEERRHARRGRRSRFRAASRRRRRPPRDFALAAGKNVLRFTSYDAKGEVLDRWPEDVIVPPMGTQPLALATPRFFLARSAFELRALQIGARVHARGHPAAAQDRPAAGRDRVLRRDRHSRAGSRAAQSKGRFAGDASRPGRRQQQVALRNPAAEPGAGASTSCASARRRRISRPSSSCRSA